MGFLRGKLAGPQGHSREWEDRAGLGLAFCIPDSFFFKLSPGLPFAVFFTTITIIQYNHHEAWMKRN